MLETRVHDLLEAPDAPDAKLVIARAQADQDSENVITYYSVSQSER